MLFLYTLLFFVLGTSVVALPGSPPTSHLTRRRTVTSDDPGLNGYWLYSKENKNRIIKIKNNQILEALPKLMNPATDLLHTIWKRATQSSVEAANLPVPKAMMKNIPNKADKGKLKILEPIMQRRLRFKAKFKPSGSPKVPDSWQDKVLEVMQNAIDESGSGAT